MPNVILTLKKRLNLLTFSLSFSILLLVIRMQITETRYFLFLIWNLFLAFIPYAITTYLISLKTTNRFLVIASLSVWLLFLPNAPYIVTDLLHLKYSSSKVLWLDVLMIFSFAVNGLMLFYYSIKDCKTILERYFNSFWVEFIIISILFLSSFGMYLGRFLRYNSWEILNNPSHIISDIVSILTQPKIHYNAWLFTLCFGVALSIGYYIFKNLKTEIK